MSDLDMRKVKKIPHPLIDEFAKRYADLQSDITKRVQEMSDSEAQRLRLSVESLTSTNCWFVEKDMQPMVEFALSMRQHKKERGAADQIIQPKE